MYQRLIILFGLFTAFAVKGQGVVLNGHLVDSTSNLSLSKSSILLLEPKTDILYKFCLSNTVGNFQFNQVAPGSYKLVINSLNYEDYTDTILVGDANLNLGSLFLKQKAHLLAGVIVQDNKKKINLL